MRIDRFSKILVLSGLCFVLSSSLFSAMAQDVIRASGGENLSIDRVQTGEFATLSGPSIRETAAGQLEEGGTIVLTLPAGYEWNDQLTVTELGEVDEPGVDDEITYKIIARGANATDLQVTFTSISSTEILITVNNESDTRGQGWGPGRIDIEGLELRPTSTNVPNEGQISNTGTTGPDVNYGDLSTTGGEISIVNVETKADGSGQIVPDQNLRAGDNLTVYSIARDIAGNFIENITLDDPEDWSLINTDGVQQSALSVGANRRSATLSSQFTGSAQIRAFVDNVDLEPTGTITVTPRSASSMEIATQPSSTATAGENFEDQPIIELRDQFGNLVTTDSETEITAERAGGEGDLSGTLTRPAIDGVVTFDDLSIEKANTITLRFTSGNLNNLVSEEITVESAAPTDLIYIQQPRSTVAGNIIDPPVEVQLLDEFENFVPNSGTTVTIRGLDDQDEPVNNFFQGNPSDERTAVTNANGIAVFDDLRIRNNLPEGEYRLQAEFDEIVVPINSRLFGVIDSGSLAGFAITDTNGNPITDKKAGETIDILITAVDGDNNIFTDFEGSVDVTADVDILDNGNTVESFTTGDFTTGELQTTIRLGSTGNTQIFVENTTLNRNGESNEFNVTPTDADFNNTLFTADPTQITANGESMSEIRVQLRDEFENNLDTGGENITIETDTGELSGDNEDGLSVAAVDNEDGTYTAQLTSSTAIETANLEAFENGNSIGITAVDFTAGDVEELLIFLPEDGEGNIEEQTAGEEFQITIRAVDSNGNIVESYSGELELSSNSTIITTVQISDGESDHNITLTQSGTNTTISAEDTEVFGIEGTSSSFIVNPATPSLTDSEVLTNPGTIQNDGTSTSTITIILRDEFNNRIRENLINDLELDLEQLEEGGTQTGNQQPNAEITSGLAFNSTSFTYQAELTANTSVELVEISASFNNSELAQKATVDIVVPNSWEASAPGPSSDDWNTAGNWSLGTVPVQTDFVIIPGNVDPPNLDLNIEIGSLRIEEGADLILFGGNSIDVSGLVEINGSLDIEDNTSLIVGGSLTGSGTFSSGESTDIEIAGDVTIQNLLARTTGTSLKFNGSSQQTITTPNLLIQRMEVLNDVIVTEGDLIDTAEIFVSEGNTLELQEGAGTTLDNLENISGDGALILNDNTLVVRGDLSLLNLDTSEGTVVFGVREDENPTNFDLQQQQIANLTQMRNATINNDQGVRTFDDIIIDDDGQLRLLSGELIIGSGQNFIAQNILYDGGSLTFRRSLSQPGWRLLSSPVTNTFGDWFNGLTLQGMTGTTFSDRQPNLLFYDETVEGTDNQRWRTPGDASGNLTPGRGYFFYVFGNVSGDDDYNDSLPQTLTVSGQEHDAGNSPFDLNVTYTAEADTGFNLVGNPFGATINWDDPSWVKENMDNVIYIWDQASNQYKTWNGVSGSHNSGNIAPFQGFWVKANNADSEIAPSLQVSRDAKSTGGVFRKSRNATVDHEWPIIEMQVEGAEMQHSTHFTFTDSGRNNIDNMDAYRLLPFDTNTYLEVFTLLDDGTELAITNLPRKFGKTIKLPLHISGVKEGSFIDNTISLSWPKLINIPDGWTITLVDNDTNKRVNLLEENFYDFTLNERAKAPPAMNSTTNFRLVQKSVAKKQSARFTIEIDPGADADGTPNEVELDQNFSNPFSETTTIRFGIPREQRAKIEVYDVLGRLVQTITDQRYDASYHQIEFNGRSLASGVYFYRLVTEEKTIVKKMTLVK